MENKINKNINTEVRWKREITNKKRNGVKPQGKICGLYILDKKEKSKESPNGYCGSIELLDNGILQIYTNGKYRFIKKEVTERLIEELLRRIT